MLGIKLFFRKHFYDLLITGSALILLFISSQIKDPKIAQALSASTIILFFFLIIYFRLRSRDFYFLAMKKREDKDDWIGRGELEYSRVNKCFQITKADPGYIYSPCLNWSNYRLEFKFKLRTRCLGVLLRAVNLSNHVMLQITEHGIRPHVRVNGGWRAWEAEEAGLRFTEDLSTRNWYKTKMTCDKEVISIEIFYEEKKIFDKEWNIPNGNLIFEFKHDENDTRPVRIPFPINLEYGSIGFRNGDLEKALVKDILIEKI